VLILVRLQKRTLYKNKKVDVDLSKVVENVTGGSEYKFKHKPLGYMFMPRTKPVHEDVITKIRT
jgi:hypothetical protein